MIVTRDYAGGFGVAVLSQRNRYGHWRWSVPYISLMYSAGILASQGHDIAYVDAQAERLDAANTIARVRRFKPEVIVAVVNLPSIEGDAYLLDALRKKCSGAKLICIGTVCKAIPDELGKMNFADVIVLGEPESVLPILVRRISDNREIDKVSNIGIVDNGRLHVTRESEEIADFESLPWPPYRLMPTTRYRDPYFGRAVRFLTVWTSKGCPMPCSFYCPYPLGLGKTTRFRSSEDVLNEIEYLHREFGVTGLIFRDQTFTLNQSRAEEICDLLISRKMRIRWLCETRFDAVNENLLKKMKKAGCSEIHFGLESGDPVLLKRIGKPGMKLSTVKEAIKLTKKVGIKPMTHVIVGLPGETPQTIRKTHDTLKETGITRVNVNIATPYPGTPLFKYALRKGLIETLDWTRYTSFNRVMRTESMSTAELEKWASFLNQNLLGETPGRRILSLCKGRGIVEYISSISSKIWHDPSLALQFAASFFSTGDLRRTMMRLREDYDDDS